MKTAALALLSLSLSFVFPTFSASDAFGMGKGPELERVSEGIFRSGRPDSTFEQRAKDAGLKTVIDLENDDVVVAQERARAKKIGVAFHAAPIDPWVEPTAALIEGVLAKIADPARRPILVHCRQGEDRTGLVIGLYRIRHEGWSVDQAYEEMAEHDFHPNLLGLRAYWEHATGYELPWL